MTALYVLHGANYILPLVTLPYLLRVLGAENFGRIAFAQALIAYFIVLSNYGFNLSATRRVAQIRDDPGRLSRFIISVMLVKTCLMLAGFLMMLGVVWIVPGWREDAGLYLVTFLAVLGGVIFPAWLFQGLERMRHITMLSLSARLVTVIAIFVFVTEAQDYRLAAGIQASAGVLSGLAALVVIPRLVALTWELPRWTEIRETLSDGWDLFISNVAINLYSSSNIFILGLLTSPVAVGYFAAADKLVRAVAGLLSPLSQALFPHVAGMAARNFKEAIAINRRLLWFQGSLTLGISVLLIFVAGPVVLILFGAELESSIALIQVMAFLPFIIGISNVLGIQTMLNFGMNKAFSRILVLSGIVNLILLFSLVPQLEAMGAAISVVISELFVTLTMAIVLWRTGFLMPLLFRRTHSS